MTRVDPSVTACRDSDGGVIIAHWLIKLVVTLAIIGVVAIDGISVLSAQLQLQDATVTAARKASETMQRTKNRKLVALEADRALYDLHQDNELDPGTLLVGRDNTVTLSASRTATTLLLSKIGPLEQYATVHATGSARPI
jgi:Flp pilus assembly protein TadG